MKKFGAFALLLCLLVSLICPMTSSAELESDPDKSVQLGCHSIDAQTPLLGSVPYTDNARSVILYETKTDTLMYAYNADEQMYPSSFVKIMTCLIAVEKGNLEDVITVREELLSSLPKDAVSADLCHDEVISLKDLLYCMMVHSANDAAVVIADYIGGSVENFVAEMNAYATSLGCTGTKFMNPHGLHHPEQVTTARDTAKILAAAMKNETFAKIFGTAFYAVPSTNKYAARYLETINHLINDQEYAIYYDLRVTGGRTGVTDDGYRCVAAASEADGLEMISVVMGTHSTFEEDSYVIKIIGGFMETRELLDMGYAGYREAQILYEGRILKQQAVTNGTSDVLLGSTDSISTVLPYGAEDEDLVYRYNDIPGAFEAPITKGQVLSNVEIWYGSVCLGQTDLIAMNDVASVLKDAGEQTGAAGDSGYGSGAGLVILWVFLGLLGVAAIFVLSMLLIRRLRLVFARRRSKKYRRGRRRSR